LNWWAAIVTLKGEAYDTFDTGFAALVFTSGRKSCRIASNAVRLRLLSKSKPYPNGLSNNHGQLAQKH
jgi:hypothetical protein